MGPFFAADEMAPTAILDRLFHRAHILLWERGRGLANFNLINKINPFLGAKAISPLKNLV